MSTAPKGPKKGAIPLNEFLALRQQDVGMKNLEFAAALGYESQNVVAMIRKGSMALPLNRIGAAAKALGVNKVVLLKKALEERQPELLEALEDLIGNSLVTDNELALLAMIRKETKNVDFDFKQYPAFIEAIRPQLQSIAKREAEVHRASVEAMNRNYKPGPKPAKVGT